MIFRVFCRGHVCSQLEDVMNFPKSLLLLSICLVSGSLQAQQGASHRIDGSAGNHQIGKSLTICSDSALQPDGYPDIVFTDTSTEVAWYSVIGASPQLTDFITLPDNNYGGGAVSGFDLDGDNWDELWVPTTYNSWGTTRYPGLLFGGAYPHVTLGSFQPETNAFPVGDVNSDGSIDLATFDGSNLRIRSGAAIGTEILRITDQDLGFSCAPLGDLNLDGYPDFAATAPSIATGSLQAFSGGMAGNVGNKLWTFYAQNPDDRLEALVNVGDWNNDGHQDLAVGSPGYDPPALSDAGRIYIISGLTGTEIGHLDGFAPGLRMGDDRRLAAGDLTGDGKAELIVGMPWHDPNGTGDAGCVRVYEWDGNQLNLIRGHDGENAGDNFGYRVAFGNDLDGDGISDYVASSPQADPSGLGNAGSVFVFSGIGSGGPLLSAPASVSPGKVLPVTVSNAPLRSYAVLLGGARATGSSVFGHQLELGLPHYTLMVAGPVSLSGTIALDFEIPDPFPVGLPFDLQLECLVLNPLLFPFAGVDSTNLITTRIQ